MWPSILVGVRKALGESHVNNTGFVFHRLRRMPFFEVGRLPLQVCLASASRRAALGEGSFAET